MCKARSVERKRKIRREERNSRREGININSQLSWQIWNHIRVNKNLKATKKLTGYDVYVMHFNCWSLIASILAIGWFFI